MKIFPKYGVGLHILGATHGDRVNQETSKGQEIRLRGNGSTFNSTCHVSPGICDKWLVRMLDIVG
jgi:hypothetical protein